MTMGAFAVLSMIEKNENDFVTTDSLAGFAKKQPALAFCFALFLFSMAGLPPALGFFGKFYLFGAAVNEGLIWLALWGVINSAIAVYYYLRPIIVMYMKDGDANISSEKLYASTVLVLVAAMFIVIMGIFSGPLFSMIERSLS
jgi:NADH-quinone oxidoreductase subunit N